MPLWSGSGTSNTLTDSKLVQNTAGTLITAFTNSLNSTGTFITNSEGGGEVGLTVQSRTNRAKLRVADNDSNAYVVAEAGKAFYGTSANGDATNITVLTSGNVGLGTTGPAYKLDVDGDVQINETLIAKAGADLILQARSSQVVGINSNGARTMTLNASNNVGIGTTSPGYKLDVSGTGQITSRIISTDNSGARFDLHSSGGGRYSQQALANGDFFMYDETSGHPIQRYFDGASGAWAWYTVGTERMRITSAGNVGIGTTSPTTKLNVSGDIAVSSGSYLSFIDSNISYNKIGRNTSVGGIQITTGASATMNLLDNGNVGVGTTAPGAKLDVRKGGTTAAHADTDLIVQDSTAALSFAQVQVLGGNNGASNLYFSDTDSYNIGGFIYNHSSNYLATNVNGSERMRITSAGNVGIGTTSPTQKLHVDGHALISAEKYYYVAGTGAGVGSDASGNLILRQNSTSLMTTSGNNATFAGNLEVQGADVTITANVIHAGDVDTYFGFNANNSWRVVTGGSERFKVTGDVHVTGSTDFAIPAGRKLYLDGQSSTYITESSDGVIDFYGDGVQLLTAKQNGTQSEVVVNEGSGDVDFRVEANTNSHAFFVEAEGAGKVGIGLTAPLANLDISNVAGTTYQQWSYDNPGANNYNLTLSETVTAGNVRFVFDQKNAGTQYSDVLVFNQGKIGVGTDEPQSKLQVDGGIQMSDDTDTAVAGKVGTMRYRTGTEYVEVDGVELVTNGDFTTNTDWNLNSNWAISGGTCNADGTSNSDINQNQNAGVIGQSYRITYVISAWTQGTISARIGSGVTAYNTGTGTFSQVVTATTTDRIRMNIASSFIGSVDSLSIVKVTAEDASYADMCMQTGASTYEWVNIVRNTY